MKNSFGTLAAVAASVTALQAEGAVVISPISNLAITDSYVELDIDGNGTYDFLINGYSENVESYDGTSRVVINADTYNLIDLPDGAVVNASEDWGSYGSYWDFSAGTNLLVGLEFSRSGQVHYGWLSMSLPSSGPDLVVSAAWESTPNQGISAGAIPEPQDAALGAGLLATVLLGMRRSRGGRSRE